MALEIVKVLHVSTFSVELIIPESFHVLHVSGRWVSQNHMNSIGGWLQLKSCWIHTQVTKNGFSSSGYYGQKNVDLPLGPDKQIRMNAVEGRGSPHIYTNL